MEELLLRLIPLMLAGVAAMVGWIGKRIYDKVDELGRELQDHRTKSENRLTRVETNIENIEHRLGHIEANTNRR